MEAKKVIKRRFEGVVVSTKQAKTVVVSVNTVKVHPKYKKRYTTSRKYQVHDETEKYQEGDKIIFIETRPISKHKKWRVL